MFRRFDRSYFANQPTQPPLLLADLDRFNVMMEENAVEQMRRLFAEYPENNIKKITVRLELTRSEDNPTATHRVIEQNHTGDDAEPARMELLRTIRQHLVNTADNLALAEVCYHIRRNHGPVAAAFFNRYQEAIKNDTIREFAKNAFGPEIVAAEGAEAEQASAAPISTSN